MLGMFLNLYLIPGGAMLLIVAFSTISLLYFYFAFALFNNIPFGKILQKSSYHGISAVKIIGSIGAGLALSLMVMGMLYKIMWWPGAAILSTMGIISLLPVGVVVFIKYLSDNASYYSDILKRVAIYGITGLVLHNWSDKIFLEYKYRNYPNYIEAVKQSKRDPDNDLLREKVKLEREKIEYRR